MEKMKVTQEQFDCLEKYKTDEEISFAINIQPHGKRPDSPIADWDSAKVARALYRGYEVEPVYHLKELVKYGKCIFEIYQIPRIGAVNLKSELGSTISHVPVTEIEKLTNDELSTEKTRRWWASNNRGVNELKTDDVVLNTQTDKIYTISEFSNKKLLTYEKVICFARDRKDI